MGTAGQQKDEEAICDSEKYQVSVKAHMFTCFTTEEKGVWQAALQERQIGLLRFPLDPLNQAL